MALENYRSTTVDDHDNPVKVTPGALWGFSVINRHNADVYIKFYNKAANAINAATDTPLLTLLVPALGQVFQENRYPNYSIQTFNIAISIRAVTGSGDTDTTAPTTKPIIELQYD